MSNLTTASLRRRWTRLIVCLLLSSLLVAPASLAQQPLDPFLVKDINQQSVGGGSFVGPLTPVGDRLFFYADDAWHGREVWTSDGTAGGTHLVKDIWPGSNGSPEPFPMTALANRVVFIAADAFLSFGLWISDGTEAGTRLLAANTNPNYVGDCPSLATVGDAVYFVGYDALHGRELWVTDGTAAGTRLVADIFLGSNDSAICSLTCLGDTLFFRAYDGVHGLELWVSDGTAAGTTMVKDIQGGAGSGFPHGMTAVGDTLFFIATDGSAYHYGYGLWASDGTGPGTYRVSNIWPWYIYPEYGTYIPGIEYETLTARGDTLFFTADDGIHGNELWASDGTTRGTRMVADIAPGLYPVIQGASPNHLTAVGDTLLFYADDGVHGRELWASDGTQPGTRLVVDLNPGSAASGGIFWQAPAAVNDTLFFGATDGAVGQYKLWASDGTAAGTRLVFDISPGGLTAAGDTLYFYGGDGIWISDGTAAGTHVFAVMNSANTGSAGLHDLTAGRDTLFFGDYQTLWASDGTEAGTQPIANVELRFDLWYPYDYHLDALGDTLFFFGGRDQDHDAGLWVSDGWETGARLVKPLMIRDFLAAAREHVYFSADDGIHGYEPWVSDGTTAGTHLVSDIVPGAGGSYPKYLATLGDTLFFESQGALWVSDGTTAGTHLLANIRPYIPETSRRKAFGTLLFFADDGVHGSELWASDGTPAGTRLVKDIWPGSHGSGQTTTFATLGNTAYFSAYDGVHGAELWASDGTTAGTRLVADINPGAGWSDPGFLTAVGDTIFFELDNDAGSAELWASDGTTDGTRLVADIGAGWVWLSFEDLAAVRSTLYFQARYGGHGCEPWVSDGTPAGTQLVADIWPGDGSSYASAFTLVGDTLFFRADDGVHGSELWALPLPPLAARMYLPLIRR